MRILGIDPGTLVAGFGCIEVGDTAAAPPAAARAPAAANVVRRGAGPARLRFVEAGTFALGGRQLPLADRLLRLVRALGEAIHRLGPAELALEQAFAHRSIAAALRIGEARGVVLAEARRHGLAVFEYAPARVKLAVGGRGNAGKEQLARLVARQLGLTSPPAERDASDALAVALCRAGERSAPQALGGWGAGRPTILERLAEVAEGAPRRPTGRKA
jgi:crossover junction endodeoxyribonuclease RuvC